MADYQGAIISMSQGELSELEDTIDRGKKAFVEVGLALMDIRDRRGYQLAGFGTFDEYCQKRWQWNVRNASYYIGASMVMQEIGSQLPNLGFTQAAELSRLSTPSSNGDRRKKVIDVAAVQEVAASLDFSQSTVKDVARAVDAKLGSRRTSSVTYQNQPAIQASHGNIPLAGTSHVYTVNKQLWPEDVEQLLETLLIGRSLHLCSGKSQLGTVKLDLYEPSADIQADAANTGLEDKSFDSVLCDPPYNGDMQWNHDLLSELARLACQRIIFQHWFLPCDPDGQYKKANYFKLTAVYVWQPRTYFGRAQLISVFDAE